MKLGFFFSGGVIFATRMSQEFRINSRINGFNLLRNEVYWGENNPLRS